MPDTNRPAGFPDIPARPEILDALRALGTHAADADTTYQLLRGIVQAYLPPQASLRQGKLVGMMLAYALVPPRTAPRTRFHPSLPASNDRVGDLRRTMQALWREACMEEPSPLAADQGVRYVTAELMLLCWEPWIEVAFDVLNRAKIHSLFPPTGIY